MKTAIVTLLVTLLATANAFTNTPVGKALPRLGVTTTEAPRLTDVVTTSVNAAVESPRNKESIVLNNMLRSYANWNDVWDGDYGYGGMMGPYRGGYRRGGYGGYGYGGYGGGYGGYG
jgi:hypothetical protein